ncbi:fibroblast growth factor 5 [Boleophthalmus pectinirostris]|uniref:fibroblast growth factor 5 n=1 Tax=Boleophthalmus pectinirostris TaxID=150288 RepID=UPI00243310B0|nr:fibroblast growth factor 5 [Boleophthalmus pectinirostris]
MNVALYVVTVAQCVYAASVGVGRAAVEGRRTCRLYCRVGIGFHLQIHEDGRVNGSHEPNHLSVLELFSVSQGVIGIRGVHADRYMCMNHRGRLHATEHFSEDCQFRERFQENSYNTYASVAHGAPRSGRQWYVALNKRGKAKMGSSPRVRSQHVSTHFLPRGGLSGHGGLGFTIAQEQGQGQGSCGASVSLSLGSVTPTTTPTKTSNSEELHSEIY